MTLGGTLYVALVLATFGIFAAGLARASWEQTQRDRAAQRATQPSREHPAYGHHA